MKKFVVSLLLCLACASAQDRRVVPATPGRRMALVIGNNAYPWKPLTNSVADAQSIARLLPSLGFAPGNITLVTDTNLKQMQRAARDFISSLRANDVAFVYYSGHGVEVRGENYLIPVDFPSQATELEVEDDAYSAQQFLRNLEASPAQMRLLILDACRDNPLLPARSAAGGLARMDGKGTLVVFATGEGKTASDNPGGRNGLFTAHLLQALPTPGRSVDEIIKQVARDVYRESGERQLPAYYGELLEDLVLVPGTGPGNGSTIGSTPPPDRSAKVDAASEAWQLIKDSKSPEDFEDFVRSFPGSDLAPVAKLRAEQLRRMAGAALPRVDAPKIPSEGPSARSRVNAKDGLPYVWIPPGQFNMGCSPGSQCFDDAKPAHQVTISKGFWMGQTEVTQQAYVRMTGTNPSQFVGMKRPVENVGFNQARTYCEEVGGRLPTEAEWEYAARAGTTGDRYGDLDAISWHLENSGGQTHNVGEKQPNAWGLYDILGNVWEWVADFWTGYPADHVVDPKGPPAGQARTMRGGSYAYRIWGSTASSRYKVGPPPNGGAIGFRCVAEQL